VGNRLSKIYTRTGDDGTTGLGDGTRVPKDDARVEAYGSVDECNSAIGMVLAVPGLPDPVRKILVEVQHELFDLGGELCIPGHRAIGATQVAGLELALDEFNETLPSLREFILPGGGTRPRPVTLRARCAGARNDARGPSPARRRSVRTH
jgi:cob(I)alamin adenosyltransferase